MKKLFKVLGLAALLATQTIQSAEVITDTLRLRPGTLPGTGQNGQLRVDSADQKLKKYNSTATAWQEISGSGGSGINFISNSDIESGSTGYTAYKESDSVTFTDSGDTVGLSAHTLQNGDQVAFTSITSTTGISTGTLYYVVGVATNTFQVASTLGGSALALTTNGSGTLVRAKPKTGGSGGSPTLTVARTTTTPLVGTGSLLITKDAANRMGEGVSYDFTVDKAYKTSPLSFTFPYEIASGTFVPGTDGSSATLGDLNIWIYDVTNSVLIQPSGFKTICAVVGTQCTQTATFQGTGSTSYRAIFHVSSVSTSAWTHKSDSIKATPEGPKGSGVPSTGWTSTTCSGSWVSNTTYTCFVRRMGDSADFRYTLSLSGAPTSAGLTVNLPSGMVIDTTRIGGTTANPGWHSTVKINDNGTDQFDGQIGYSSTTAFAVFSKRGQSSANPVYIDFPQITQAIPMTWASGDTLNIEISGVPIVGWSSNVAMSDSTDTRVVALSVQKASGNHTSSGSDQDVGTWSTPSVDTHGAFNATTGIYTVPVPGIYEVSGVIGFAANATGSRYFTVQKNGSGSLSLNAPSAATSGTVDTHISIPSVIVSLNAGDTLRLRGFQNSGGSLAYTTGVEGVLNIKRLSGPSTIASSEVVAARYNTSATSISSTAAKITFTNKIDDTHSGYSSGTYTVPVAGWYKIEGQLAIVTTPSVDHTAGIYIYRNGSAIKSTLHRYKVASSTSLTISVTDTYKLNAGDTIEIYADSEGSGPSIVAVNTRNVFSIIKEN